MSEHQQPSLVFPKQLIFRHFQKFTVLEADVSLHLTAANLGAFQLPRRILKVLIYPCRSWRITHVHAPEATLSIVDLTDCSAPPSFIPPRPHFLPTQCGGSRFLQLRCCLSQLLPPRRLATSSPMPVPKPSTLDVR